MNEFNFKSYDNSKQSISYCEVDKCKAVIELRNQLDKLEEENEELNKYIKHLHNLCGNETDKQYKYKQALAEIKEIAEKTYKTPLAEKDCINCDGYLQQILQKISECEVEDVANN